MQPRSFIAAVPPAEVRDSVYRLFSTAERAALRAEGLVRSWTAPENLHCTLQFLGEVDPARVCAELERVAGELRSVPTRVGGSTMFLAHDALVVPVMGLEPLVRALHAQLGHLVDPSVEVYDEFLGHMTLGRLPPGTGSPAALERIHRGHDWWVDAVELLASSTAPRTYSHLHRARLRGTEN